MEQSVPKLRQVSGSFTCVVESTLAPVWLPFLLFLVDGQYARVYIPAISYVTHSPASSFFFIFKRLSHSTVDRCTGLVETK